MSGYGEITAQIGQTGEEAAEDGDREMPRRSCEDDGSGTASGGSSFDNGCVDCHDFYEIHV